MQDAGSLPVLERPRERASWEQQPIEQSAQLARSCCLSQGPLKHRLSKPFPTRQWAPSLHHSSRGWDPLAPLSCAGSAPRCEERSWERRSGCGAELCCCLDNAFRLSPALTGRLGKEGGQIWAVGQPSVLVRCARPGTRGLLALQGASDLAVRCYCQHQKRSLGLCTYVDPDIKEINFDLFHIKTSHAEEGKEERIWDSPCPWTAIILIERKSSFIWA